MYASTSLCLYLDARVYGTRSDSVCNISLQYLTSWAWVSLKFLLQTASLITFVVSFFSFKNDHKKVIEIYLDEGEITDNH